MNYRFPHELPSDAEQTEILNRIVDAMLSNGEELRDASSAEFDEILRGACREDRSWSEAESTSSELLECC